jgi:hypothetical protein
MYGGWTWGDLDMKCESQDVLEGWVNITPKWDSQAGAKQSTSSTPLELMDYVLSPLHLSFMPTLCVHNITKFVNWRLSLVSN